MMIKISNLNDDKNLDKYNIIILSVESLVRVVSHYNSKRSRGHQKLFGFTFFESSQS
jgi:hypothetical protein